MDYMYIKSHTLQKLSIKWCEPYNFKFLVLSIPLVKVVLTTKTYL